ncbi:carbohydrate ABC transporter permease [Vallitalea guaymasensis]|uniref:Carbohydrate ABC transporter permease n=1 Tax=Vallitalea guaymasensis TaxID=1185412 RepID=A0A8J8MD02_9FIRM|nr:carbohydrate ABC transporter permease [Vallitalea guaymasensis]QUH30410.1 carbohydrate ABC transporter permease [Vallitalea guaymasensis]
MRRFRKTFTWLLLILGAIIFMLPFIIMIGNSFETFTFSLPNPPRLLPKEFTLDNFKEIINVYHIFNYFGNSVFITFVTTIIVIFISALSAYAFAKIPFRGRELLFKLYLFTLMIPGVLNIIPQFMLINELGMIGTRRGLILLYVGTGICGNTFFLRGFFEAIPNELIESVVVDGGSHFTIFKKIVMPLAKPAIGTLAILVLLGTWDDFLTAKIILGAKESLLTLPIVIHRINGQHATKYGLVFAASIITLIPVMLVYTINQKFFVVGGIGEGAIKE